MKVARVIIYLVLFACFAAVVHAAKDPLSGAGPESGVPAPTSRDRFVGDAVCAACHQDQSNSYLATAHHLSSQRPDKDSIHGSFRNWSDVLMIADPAKATDNPGLYFKMESRDDRRYQTAVAGWPGQLRSRTEPIDVVIGAGVRGQSYLYWRGEQLFELPVSYWAEGNQWINSPGYTNGTMNFNRPVTPRCLECHVTWIQPRSMDPLTNRYDKASLVVGLSCERCHGSGVDHVAQQRSMASGSPSGAVAADKPAVLNPARFSRERQVDVCALCHNGIRQEELTPAFTFTPGQSLDSYLQSNAGEITEHPEVHGDQVGLLKRSRCYQSSPNMSCSTCHNVHQPERGANTYSSRCLTCHQVESCGVSKTMGRQIAEKCIECHMPLQQTNAVESETAGRVIRPSIRSHWIKVYP